MSVKEKNYCSDVLQKYMSQCNALIKLKNFDDNQYFFIIDIFLMMWLGYLIIHVYFKQSSIIISAFNCRSSEMKIFWISYKLI